MTPSGPGKNASRASGFDLHPGQIVLNTWEVLEPIGQGGMGAVYRVYHRFLRKEMAMKTLRRDKVTQVNWKRFQAEAIAIARLVHPNIIQIFDMGTAEAGQPFYTMELLGGRGLDEWICYEPITAAQAVTVFRHVASALAFAHERGIIHRDIKPANIVLALAQGSKPPVVKVVDFGIAKLVTEDQALTKEGEVFGSPFYMSPEQANGQMVDSRSDIYSLGCALYETLTGVPPFKGKNAVETMMMHLDKTPSAIETVRSDLEFPDGLSQVVKMMLAKNPDERYSNASQIAHDLLQIECGLGAKVIARLTAGRKLGNQFAEIEEGPCSPSGIRASEITMQIEAASGEASHNSGESDLVRGAKPWKWLCGFMLFSGALLSLLLIAAVVAVTAITAAVYLYDESGSKGAEQKLFLRQQQRLNSLYSKRQDFYISTKEANVYKDIGMIFEKGRRYYHFSSLPNECVGEIGKFARDGSSYAWRPAKGVVALPDSVKIAFRPSKYLLAHPQLWRKFRAEDLQAIFFPRLGRLAEKADLKALGTLDKENIQELGRFRELENLDVGDVRLLSNNANSLVDALNKLANLKALTFGFESEMSTSAIINLHCLSSGKLIRLWLPTLDNLSPVIARMGKSKNIESLSISGSGATLSDFAIIAGMKQLQELDLRNLEIPRGSIGKLSVLPKLEALRIIGARCSQEEAGEFLKLRQLKTLWISFDVWGANSRWLEAMKKKLEANGVTVNIDGRSSGP